MRLFMLTLIKTWTTLLLPVYYLVIYRVLRDRREGAWTRKTRPSCVKDGATHQPVRLDKNKSVREFCWDGGIANCFPYFDGNTTIITPLAVEFKEHVSINPSIDDRYRSKYKSVRHLSLSPHVRLHLTPENGVTWKQILLSPTEDELQWRFDQGYENAATFLESQEATLDESGEAAEVAAESSTSAIG
jgi:hypothetical protein